MIFEVKLPTVKCTVLNCTILSFGNYVHPYNQHVHHLTSSQTHPPQATTTHFFLYTVLSFLELHSYKWNQTACSILCLSSFVQHNAFEII